MISTMCGASTATKSMFKIQSALSIYRYQGIIHALYMKYWCVIPASVAAVQGIPGRKEKCAVYCTYVYVKKGAILQKTDSSYSSCSSTNDRNDKSSVGTEEGWCVTDTY